MSELVPSPQYAPSSRSSLPFFLTEEQVLSLTSGLGARRQVRAILSKNAWLKRGRAGSVIWGEYPVNNRDPILVQCDLTTFSVRCSCASRVRPCNHALALYLDYVKQPPAFFAGPSPVWLREATDTPSADSLPVTSYAAVMQGLDDLERWLHDLMRAGMADLPGKPKDFWPAISHRLADVQLDELARTVKRLGSLPGSTREWPTTLLPELGRIQLQIQAFRRWDDLTPEEQGDLRLATGWLDETAWAAGEATYDRRQVVADEIRQDGLVTLRRTWLWGEASNRPVELRRVTRGVTPGGRQDGLSQAAHLLPTGTGIAGSVCFFPATTRVCGRIGRTDSPEFYQPTTRLIGLSSLDEAQAQFRTALIANPWLMELPVLLSDMTARRQDDDWLLHDRQGAAVPLPDDFSRGWHLAALGQAPDSALFGLWESSGFRPLSVRTADRWVKLDTLRGVK
ncbi:MAG: hypothetical protein KDD92_07990 [Caldilineaceae bacterium]|nr:hypothetical protein [Caldilineaceae bacterium]